MFDKYYSLREETNSILATGNSLISYRTNEITDNSIFCKKFSSMLLEIGCVKNFFKIG